MRFHTPCQGTQVIAAFQAADDTALAVTHGHLLDATGYPFVICLDKAQLSHVMEELGPRAEQVRIVFVSVDPHRDTPEILQAYVDAFDKHAIGLTGTEKQVADLARRYRVAYQIEKPRADNPNNYEVAHSRGIYMFDTKGKARLLASDGESVEALTEGVRRILDAG